MYHRPYYRELRRKGYGVSDAVNTVRRQDNFLARCNRDAAAWQKRTKAAKKGWKTRRANERMI
jgi:hypothetical protein